MEKLPTTDAVPEVFEARAKFVQVGRETDDSTRAEGPASSTVAGAMARDAEEGSNDTVACTSVVEDNMAEISNLSKLLALQMLLEKVEVQARRVVANELKALVDDSGYGALDDLGRQSL